VHNYHTDFFYKKERKKEEEEATSRRDLELFFFHLICLVFSCWVWQARKRYGRRGKWNEVRAPSKKSLNPTPLNHSFVCFLFVYPLPCVFIIFYTSLIYLFISTPVLVSSSFVNFSLCCFQRNSTCSIASYIFVCVVGFCFEIWGLLTNFILFLNVFTCWVL
jgi:hypothetical protein